MKDTDYLELSWNSSSELYANVFGLLVQYFINPDTLFYACPY